MPGALAASIVLGLAYAPAASAADSAPAPDFFFGRPTKSLSIRATWLMPREGGDLFGFVRDQLTISKGDFKTVAAIGEFGVAVGTRLTMLFGFEVAPATSVGSEYRHFIGSDNLPIFQRSTLANRGVHAGIKVALTETGRRISRYAWIPRTVAPYAGAGGGATYYEFRQLGEFVDYVDSSIFSDMFTSKGWGPAAHVFVGTDVRAWKNLYLSVEGRYVWAHAGLGADFVGFDKIDLSGFRVASGVNVVF